MSRITGTAGIAATLVLAAFGSFHATPSRAWQIDPSAVTPAVLTIPPSASLSPAPAPADPALDQSPVQPAPEAELAPVAKPLAALVAERAAVDPGDAEQRCLATAVYFEAKGEPLKGQLGVANVILNRTRSGRFPRTLCGVVRQPGQFSFVHGGRLPAIPHAAVAWKTAVAIARVALSGDAPAPAPKALFFHARYVAPGWNLTRVAAIGNHVFYR